MIESIYQYFGWHYWQSYNRHISFYTRGDSWGIRNRPVLYCKFCGVKTVKISNPLRRFITPTFLDPFKVINIRDWESQPTILSCKEELVLQTHDL